MTPEGRILTAWLGTIDPEDSADVADRWQAAAGDGKESLWPDRRNRVLETGYGAEAGTLTLRPFVLLAESATQMQPGDVRLIGWTDEQLPGMKVRPAAPQKRRLALIVANLQYGVGTDPIPDRNSRYEYVEQPKVYRDDTPDQPTEEGAPQEDSQIPNA
jgi:hypothetical protein